MDFRFFVTTKLLLKLAVGKKIIHADATYKIIWQGFPLLLLDTTDLHRSFHPFGIAVCTSEQQKDFEFIFQSVKQGVQNMFDVEFNPEILVADAAKSIHNGAFKVFGDELKIVMCWFHMLKNVSEKLPTFIHDTVKQSKFIFDLEKLQLAKSESIFDVALKLFIEKWSAPQSQLV